MVKNNNIICCALLLAGAVISCGRQQACELTGYVNTRIGTNSGPGFSRGNTYPAVTHPWGMNAWTPQTGLMADNWIYRFNGDTIRGFRQTHLPNPWIGDYGAFAIMPVSGQLETSDTRRGSRFRHSQETCKPYYYAVHLDDYDIDAELTATERCGFLRFTFDKGSENYIVLDAHNGGASVRIIPEERRIEGYCKNNSGGVPENFANYFVLVFEEGFEEFGVWDAKQRLPQTKALTGAEAGCYIRVRAGVRQTSVKVASSYISLEQARRNLEREIGNAQFDEVCTASKEVWESHLNRIRVEGGTDEQLRTFYSNMYRVLLYPRQFFEYDADGQPHYYSPYDGNVHAGYMFADNGFWDTFRSAHPFYTLLFPSMSAKIMQSIVNIYSEGGWLPRWISPGYRHSMIGSHAVSLATDAYAKGITGFDAAKILEAVQKECHEQGPKEHLGRYAYDQYVEKGYIAYPDHHQAVALTVEYAYDDFCTMKLARMLGDSVTAELFGRRAGNYAHVFDAGSGYMRPRRADGRWCEPFDPYKWGGPYTEANALQYSWSVFHDIDGLSRLLGGTDKTEEKIDALFSAPTYPAQFGLYGVYFNEVGETYSAGLGQYAHGNQPSQHIPYIYAAIGKPWKTQHYVRKIMDRLYNPTENGYVGDEDNGQTSSWYLFSALGFYPMCPGTGEYVIGVPLFEKATLTLENGKTLTVTAKDNSEQNRYVGSLKVNGRMHSKLYFTHDELLEGGAYEFEMVDSPVESLTFTHSDYPYSLSAEK